MRGIVVWISLLIQVLTIPVCVLTIRISSNHEKSLPRTIAICGCCLVINAAFYRFHPPSFCNFRQLIRCQRTFYLMALLTLMFSRSAGCWLCPWFGRFRIVMSVTCRTWTEVYKNVLICVKAVDGIVRLFCHETSLLRNRFLSFLTTPIPDWYLHSLRFQYSCSIHALFEYIHSKENSKNPGKFWKTQNKPQIKRDKKTVRGIELHSKLHSKAVFWGSKMAKTLAQQGFSFSAGNRTWTAPGKRNSEQNQSISSHLTMCLINCIK